MNNHEGILCVAAPARRRLHELPPATTVDAPAEGDFETSEEHRRQVQNEMIEATEKVQDLWEAAEPASPPSECEVRERKGDGEGQKFKWVIGEEKKKEKILFSMLDTPGHGEYSPEVRFLFYFFCN